MEMGRTALYRALLSIFATRGSPEGSLWRPHKVGKLKVSQAKHRGHNPPSPTLKPGAMVPEWLLQGEESTQPRLWVGEGAMVAKVLNTELSPLGYRLSSQHIKPQGIHQAVTPPKKGLTPFFARRSHLHSIPLSLVFLAFILKEGVFLFHS